MHSDFLYRDNLYTGAPQIVLPCAQDMSIVSEGSLHTMQGKASTIEGGPYFDVTGSLLSEIFVRSVSLFMSRLVAGSFSDC